MPTDPIPGDPPALLYCAVCGRTVRCPAAMLVGCVQTTWPVCCREVMSLYLPADRQPGDIEPPPDAAG